MAIWRTLTEIGYELANQTPLFFQNRQTFYLADNSKNADILQEICHFWNPLFPVHNIITADYLEKNKCSNKQYLDLTIRLEIQQNIDQKVIIEALVKNDFIRNTTANQKKTFAVRGEIIDIFDFEPVRVIWNKNQIAEIFSFNLVNNEKIKKINQLTIYPEKISEQAKILTDKDLKLSFISPKFYNMRWLELTNDLQKYLKIIIYTKQGYKIEKIAPQAKIIEFTEKNKEQFNPNLESFIIPEENIIFLTDENLFGSVWEDEDKSEIDQNFLNNLKVGDYVVHIDHGVAKFAGFCEINKEKYLWLQYAGTDKLYIPYEKSSRIESYVGGGSPKLHKLDDAAWEQLVAKIKQKAESIAKDLIDIYAQREIIKAPKMKHFASEDELAASFPYTLTPDQEQTMQEIDESLENDRPMDRLICGDVGFGKTELAIRTAYRAVLNGYQVAVLCPTTILVQQHFDTFTKRMLKLGVNIELLSRFKENKQQKEIIKKIKNHQVDIIIATHRLLSKDIEFNKLGLLIIDEEQKFGVKHKEAFKKIRGSHSPHVLTLTATPIPRTLNLALSGLREISNVRTPPPNRLKIKTIIKPYTEQIIKEAITKELARSGQVYYLYNEVETMIFAEKKLKQLFPHSRIAHAHGQMEPSLLARTMAEFDGGQIDILICSTIIENGLDIPNANTLIVEKATDFGLSQLHQIRGRIGRSFSEAFAYFLYEDKNLTIDAAKRLKALQEFSDLGSGYELAMKDLEIRGIGNILGREQSGHAEAVGLNLYLRLINKAVKELSGINNAH